MIKHFVVFYYEYALFISSSNYILILNIVYFLFSHGLHIN